MVKVMLIHSCGECPNNHIHADEIWTDICSLINKKIIPNKIHDECPLHEFTDITHRPLD